MPIRSLLGSVWRWLTGHAAVVVPSSLPKVVYLIRHGEKSGKKGDIHLNARGSERANALPSLFGLELSAPNFIFATKATANSNRPIETVSPLARKFGLPIVGKFANDEFASLARELLSNPIYAGKVLLVCWHRGRIPALAAALGASGRLPEWTDKQFDRIWRIDYGANGTVVSDLPQRLLAGDSPK